MKRIFIFLICFSIANLVSSQINKRITLNNAVRYGRLENGFQYYILNHRDISGKVAMSLVVNAGMYDEASDQHGLAHLVEHLGMRTTTNFATGTVDFWKGKGLRSGTDIHATTGITTNYYLTIPQGSNELLDTGIATIRDWACGIRFLPGEIEEERSAVYHEASNANSPVHFAQMDTKFHLLNNQPLYANNIMRDMESVKNTAREPLIRFYNEWYHPMHQAVFIVGDVNINEVEASLRNGFSKLSNEGAKSKEDIYKVGKVPVSGKDRLIIVEHGEEDSSIYLRIFKKKQSVVNSKTIGTEVEFRISLLDKLMNEMIRHRLGVMRDGNSLLPEVIAIERRTILPLAGVDAIIASQVVKESLELRQVIESILKEMYRLEQYGFTNKEYVRARDIVLLDINDSTKPSSDDLMTRLIEYHFEGKAFPSVESELKSKLFNEINLSEINDTITSWLRTKGNMDVVLSVPKKEDLRLPSQTEVFTWITQVQNKKVLQYKQPEIKSLPAPPKQKGKSGYIIKKLPEIGAVRMEFKNGAKVIIKTLPRSEVGMDIIKLRGYNRSIDPEHNTKQMEFALLADIENFLGVTSIDAGSLKLLKREKQVSVRPYIKNGDIQVQGTTTNLEQAEFLLHLVYLYMSSPTADYDSFKKYCLRSLIDKSERIKSGSQLFYDTLEAITGSFVRPEFKTSPPTTYSREKLYKTFKLYQTNFCNAAEFEFVITGTLNEKEMIALVGRYIGALHGSCPRMRSKFTSKKEIATTKFIPGATVTLVGDSVNNVNVRVLFSNKEVVGVQDKLTVLIVRDIIKQILFRRLREKEKGIYDVSVSSSVSPITNEFFLEIAFETAPLDVDRMITAAKEELTLLANSILTPDIFTNAVANVRVNLIAEINSPDFWVQYLKESEYRGNFSTDELRQVEMLESIRPADVAKSVRDFLDRDCMLFKLL